MRSIPRPIVLAIALAPVALTLAALALAALALTAPRTAAAADKEQREKCAGLSGLKIEDVNILSARAVQPLEKDLPETCRVLGYVRPAINFELHMPIKIWNEKLLMTGCDGFCGRIELGSPTAQNTVKYALGRQYAAVATDAGHWAPTSESALWAYNDPQAEIDFGRRAAPTVAAASKRLIDAFYAEDLRFSYFAGCGNGGRQGVMTTVTHPDLFDGVIAGAPMLRMTETLGTRAAWFSRAIRDPTGERSIGAEEAVLVARRAYRSCDAKDGVADGLISEPMSCAFDPASLACNGRAGGGEDGPTCLVDAKIGAVKRLYERPRNTYDDRLAASGQIPGAEPFWAAWITGDLESNGDLERMGGEFLRYLAFDPDPGRAYRIDEFFMDRDPEEMAAMSEIVDVPVDPEAVYGDRGGRLIFYHGWADAAVSPLGTIEYLHALQQATGDREDWAALYLAPGMGHCAADANLGPDQFDLLTVLEGWVEQGAAPGPVSVDEISEAGDVVRSGLLCPYPRRAEFTGGDPVKATAKNFRCVAGDPIRTSDGN